MAIQFPGYTDYSLQDPFEQPKSLQGYLGQILKNEENKIANQYLPEKLRLANELSAIDVKYKPEDYETTFGSRRASTAHTNALTQSANITNRFLPELQRLKLQEARMGTENPLLGRPGIEGQIGAMLYLAQQGKGLPEEFQGYASQPEKQRENNVASFLPEYLSTKPKDDMQGGLFRAISGEENVAHGRKSTLDGQGFSPAQLLSRNIQAELEKQSVSNQRAKQLMNLAPSMRLNADDKRYYNAQVRAAGFDPAIFWSRVSQGENPDDLFAEKGYKDGERPDPNYAATVASLSRDQLAETSAAGLNAISSEVREWQAPYARKFHGYSPKAVIDSISSTSTGKPDVGLQKYIAATAMRYDQAALRNRMAGVIAGVTSIREMTNATLEDANITPLTIGEENFRGAQIYIEELLNKMRNAEHKKTMSLGRKMDSEENSDRFSGNEEEDLKILSR